MAEFLTAEEIAAAKSGSITDSQLQSALDQRRQAYNIPSHTQHKGKNNSTFGIIETFHQEQLEGDT